MERSNSVIEDKIAAIKKDEGYDGQMSYPWAFWLPRIMFNMNTQYLTTTKETPYKVVFGQMPRHAIIPGAAQHIVHEEDIESFVQPASGSSQPAPTASPIALQKSPPVTPRT